MALFGLPLSALLCSFVFHVHQYWGQWIIYEKMQNEARRFELDKEVNSYLDKRISWLEYSRQEE
jgi:hypothetical protein